MNILIFFFQVSHIETASRWFDGLISKDAMITKEVYSVGVEFDRQVLYMIFFIRNLKQTYQYSLFPACAEFICRMRFFTVLLRLYQSHEPLDDPHLKNSDFKMLLIPTKRASCYSIYS